MIKLRRRPAFDFAVGDGELSGHEVDRLEIGGRHERATVLLGAAAGQLHVELIPVCCAVTRSFQKS